MTRNKLQRAALAPLMLSGLLLTACGGGSSDSVTDITLTPESTALADNRVVNGFQFDQYQQADLNVSLGKSAASLNGDLYVVKVYDDEGNSYFLGQAKQLDDFDLVVSVPRHIKKLNLEVFTNRPEAGRVEEEILL